MRMRLLPLAITLTVWTHHKPCRNHYANAFSINQVHFSRNSVPSNISTLHQRKYFELIALSSSKNSESDLDPLVMRVKDIKDELQGLGVSYDDCFDKESLVQKLLNARENTTANSMHNDTTTDDVHNDDRETSDDLNGKDIKSFDRKETASELRKLKVKELRTMCAENKIRWANMIEKEDLVQALVNHKEKASLFSISGNLIPGEATDIDGKTLEQEVEAGASTPLLLDVYATWCGPCLQMAPQLKDAAQELGETVRVAKIDSDKYPQWASKLKVGGLPTLILFDGKSGKEFNRVEGALMKDQLLQFARSM